MNARGQYWKSLLWRKRQKRIMNLLERTGMFVMITIRELELKLACLSFISEVILLYS